MLPFANRSSLYNRPKAPPLLSTPNNGNSANNGLNGHNGLNNHNTAQQKEANNLKRAIAMLFQQKREAAKQNG